MQILDKPQLAIIPADDKKLFRVILRVTSAEDEDARKIGQDIFKAFQDADVKYEFWGHGTRGTINMEFTTMYSMNGGAEVASKTLARKIANICWKVLDQYRDPIKVKVAPMMDFVPSTPIYVLDDDVYYCDFWDDDYQEILTERKALY